MFLNATRDICCNACFHYISYFISPRNIKIPTSYFVGPTYYFSWSTRNFSETVRQLATLNQPATFKSQLATHA